LPRVSGRKALVDVKFQIGFDVPADTNLAVEKIYVGATLVVNAVTDDPNIAIQVTSNYKVLNDFQRR